MKGQINLNSKAGDLIYQTVLSNNIENILEIGTWNGMGSTQCVIQALKDRGKKANFLSIELYPEMYDQALENLKNDLDYVKLLNGSIISEEELDWFDHSAINFNNDLHAKLYYHKDVQYLKSSKNLYNEVQSSIDFLILDGGEYSTYPEWQKLKDRVLFVFLDDTNILKCSKIRREIIESKDFEIIQDDLRDRNGYSLFKKNK